jgi:hypothetical protein
MRAGSASIFYAYERIWRVLLKTSVKVEAHVYVSYFDVAAVSRRV